MQNMVKAGQCCARAGGSPLLPLFSRLAVVKVDGDEPREMLIALDDILYFFTGAALVQQVIHASWTAPTRPLRSDRLYARTGKGIFLTFARTLAELQQRLDPNYFIVIHQSLIAHIHKIVDLDLRHKLKRVGFPIGTGTAKEWLTVSRRNLTALRACFGLPVRNY